MKLTIGKKVLLGYIPLLILIVSLSLFTLYKLNQVNHINSSIITKDLVINKAAENMIDILLAQESYGRRYMILKSEDILSLFWKRNQEFETSFKEIKEFSGESQFASLSSLEQYHADYNKFFQSGLKHLDSTTTYSFMYADSLRKNSFTKQTELLNNLVSVSKKNQMSKTQQTADIGNVTFRMVTIVSISGITLAIIIAMLITSNIRKGIQTLKVAAGIVSIGNFDYLPSVNSKDELGDLSRSFNDMATRLSQLEEQAVDSSPLTRLPGGIAIENACKKRIEVKEPFAFCMMDLDNFKPFNDRYGYSRGNSVIKETAKIIQKCTQELGTQNDFVGHIGGDDFALLSTPEKFEAICNKVIKEFDNKILDFYNEDDKKNGFISSKNRQGKKLTFPIMTISISGLNSNKSYVENYIQVGEIMAELKKYAKTFPNSNLVIDRRGGRMKEQKV